MGKPHPETSASLVPRGVGAELQPARRPKGGWETVTRFVSVALAMLLAVTMLPAAGLQAAYADEPVERPATSGGDVALSSTNGTAATASQAPVAETREDGMHVAGGLAYTVADGGLSLVGFDGEAAPEGMLAVPAAVMLDGRETPVVAIDLAEGQTADKVTILALPQSVKSINTDSLASALPGLASVEVAAAAGSSLPAAAGAASMRAAYSTSGGMVFRPATVEVQNEDAPAEAVECKELLWAPPALAVARIPVECRAIAEGAFANVRDLRTIVAFGTMARIAEGALTSEQLSSAKVVVPNESPAVVSEGTERVSASMALMGDEGQMERRRPWHEAGFASDDIVMGKPYGSLTETVAVTPEGAVERAEAMLVSYPGMHPEATDVKHPGEDGKIDMAESGLAFTVKSDMTASVAWQGDKTATPAHLDVPASVVIDGVTYPVTEVAASAFEGAAFLASVAIPEGVVSIGENAFAGCANLRELDVPPSVRSVGAAAFAGTGFDGFVAPDATPATEAVQPVDAVPSEGAASEGADIGSLDGAAGEAEIASEVAFTVDAEGDATAINEGAANDPSAESAITPYSVNNYAVYYRFVDAKGNPLAVDGSFEPRGFTFSGYPDLDLVGFTLGTNNGGVVLEGMHKASSSWDGVTFRKFGITYPKWMKPSSLSVSASSPAASWAVDQISDPDNQRFFMMYPATGRFDIVIGCSASTNGILEKTPASLADLTAYAPLARVYDRPSADAKFAAKNLLSKTGETAFTSTDTVRGAIDEKADADHEHDAADVTSGTFGADRLADAAVTAAKLASSSVETAKIKDKNVTTAKLADKAVTSDKLAEEYAKAGDFGTIAYSGLDDSDMSVYPTSYRKGGAPALPEPKRAGYRFTGWTWDGRSTPTADANEVKKAFADGDKTVTLTANWSAPEATYFFTEDKPLDPTGTGVQQSSEIFVKLSDSPAMLRRFNMKTDNSLGLFSESVSPDNKIRFMIPSFSENTKFGCDRYYSELVPVREGVDGSYGVTMRVEVLDSEGVLKPSAFPSSLVSGSSVLKFFEFEYELA